MDDPLKALADSLAEIDRDDEPDTGLARVVRDYAAWAAEVAVPALEKVRDTVEDPDTEVLLDADGEGEPPRPQLGIYRAGQPPFVYRLLLHGATGPEFPYVLRERTEYDAAYRPGADVAPPQPTSQQAEPFFAETEGGRSSDAREITEEDVIRDVGAAYLEHRRRWEV